jgi:ABC-type transporter Mla MlaB component
MNTSESNWCDNADSCRAVCSHVQRSDESGARVLRILQRAVRGDGPRIHIARARASLPAAMIAHNAQPSF